MKKLIFAAAVLLIAGASACQKDAIVAPSKSVIKKASTSKDAADDTKRVAGLDGNPAL